MAVQPEAIYDLLLQMGEDPKREGLKDTPARVAKAWGEWLDGMDRSPEDILKMFGEEKRAYNAMVFLANIPVYSHCEHHLAPFFGVAHLAYIPGGPGIVGLSKLPELVNIYAHRLQVQERMTQQIADALFNDLNAVGAGVVVRCRHLCMESRGKRSSGTETTTTALRGSIFADGRARAEFLQYVAISESRSSK